MTKKECKKKYNATYRARKQGIQIATQEKTCYTKSFEDLPSAVRILQREFNYGIQLTF